MGHWIHLPILKLPSLFLEGRCLCIPAFFSGSGRLLRGTRNFWAVADARLFSADLWRPFEPHQRNQLRWDDAYDTGFALPSDRGVAGGAAAARDVTAFSCL